MNEEDLMLIKSNISKYENVIYVNNVIKRHDHGGEGARCLVITSTWIGYVKNPKNPTKKKHYWINDLQNVVFNQYKQEIRMFFKQMFNSPVLCFSANDYDNFLAIFCDFISSCFYREEIIEIGMGNLIESSKSTTPMGAISRLRSSFFSNFGENNKFYLGIEQQLRFCAPEILISSELDDPKKIECAIKAAGLSPYSKTLIVSINDKVSLAISRMKQLPYKNLVVIGMKNQGVFNTLNSCGFPNLSSLYFSQIEFSEEALLAMNTFINQYNVRSMGFDRCSFDPSIGKLDDYCFSQDQYKLISNISFFNVQNFSFIPLATIGSHLLSVSLVGCGIEIIDVLTNIHKRFPKIRKLDVSHNNSTIIRSVLNPIPFPKSLVYINVNQTKCNKESLLCFLSIVFNANWEFGLYLYMDSLLIQEKHLLEVLPFFSSSGFYQLRGFSWSQNIANNDIIQFLLYNHDLEELGLNQCWFDDGFSCFESLKLVFRSLLNLKSVLLSGVTIWEDIIPISELVPILLNNLSLKILEIRNYPLEQIYSPCIYENLENIEHIIIDFSLPDLKRITEEMNQNHISKITFSYCISPTEYQEFISLFPSSLLYVTKTNFSYTQLNFPHTTTIIQRPSKYLKIPTKNPLEPLLPNIPLKIDKILNFEIDDYSYESDFSLSNLQRLL